MTTRAKQSTKTSRSRHLGRASVGLSIRNLWTAPSIGEFPRRLERAASFLTPLFLSVERSPELACPNATDRSRVNAELQGELRTGLTLSKSNANRPHLLRGKLRVGALLSAQPTTHVTLGTCVGHVVRRRAQEEVSGVTARWVVAVVTDKQPVGDRAVRQLPRNSMRLPPVLAYLEPSVGLEPRTTPGALPKPAALSALHASPEALGIDARPPRFQSGGSAQRCVEKRSILRRPPPPRVGLALDDAQLRRASGA